MSPNPKPLALLYTPLPEYVRYLSCTLPPIVSAIVFPRRSKIYGAIKYKTIVETNIIAYVFLFKNKCMKKYVGIKNTEVQWKPNPIMFSIKNLQNFLSCMYFNESKNNNRTLEILNKLATKINQLKPKNITTKNEKYNL